MEIGKRSHLTEIIQEVTKIPVEVLKRTVGQFYMVYSVAQRMSWSSMRVTTRAEDIAYCLLGLFEINMPLLYGEGAKRAFRRLQEEIVNRSTDRSILAWKLSRNQWDLADYVGPVLADSPAKFKDSNDIVYNTHGVFGKLYQGMRMSYSMTNHGLHISMPLIPCPSCNTSGQQNGCYLALLSCFKLTKAVKEITTIGISVQRDSSGQFERSHLHHLQQMQLTEALRANASFTELFIRTEGSVVEIVD